RATGIEHAQILQRHVAWENDSLLQPRATHRLPDSIRAAAHPAHHHEVQFLSQSRRTAEGLYQADNVLARLRTAAGKHKRFASDSVAHLDRSLHGRIDDRVELLAHSGAHNSDPLPRHAIQLNDI